MSSTYSLLIYCTCLCIVNEFLASILKPLISVVTQFGKSQFSDERTEINKTKYEMDKLSITEDFAKYIKLQRKLNKLQDELKSNVTGHLNRSMKIRYGIKYGIYIILHIVHVVICWSHWKTPVVVLPDKWLYPFSSVLSWPTQVQGGISVPVWFLISHLSAVLLSKSLLRSS